LQNSEFNLKPIKLPTRSLVGLWSCENFEWFQPRAPQVTCTVCDVEAIIWKTSQLFGIPRNC